MPERPNLYFGVLPDKYYDLSGAKIFRFNGEKLKSETIDVVHRTIINAVTSEIYESFPIKFDKKTRSENIAARASLPIFNLYDQELKNRCNWLILESKGKTGLVMEYLPRHQGNTIYYCYGASEPIKEFVKNVPLINASNENAQNGIKFVLNGLLFSKQTVNEMISPTDFTAGDSSQTTQIVMNSRNYHHPEKLTKISQSVRGSVGLHMRKLDIADAESVNQLSDTKISAERLSLGNHTGVFRDDKLIALVGGYPLKIIIDIESELFSIFISGDTKTDVNERGKGYATAARVALLDDYFKTPGNQLVVADANSFSINLTRSIGYRDVMPIIWLNYLAV
ncbi:MAG: hypothetical protein UR68_C0002G0046 [Candidatus Roizmanbacteria bacterium GW2011_GWA2_35_19]|uniref:Uncharacterized protein n=2 Tax=Candidatus Roizmaniibacteriota TaxID=1752723 RepID=A0A0G0BX71_9BACT|nr:MAG: hypothetical protein UR63_C0018G0003 [Candidatus Roizmanbacteria bacterium GW2011_GWC2_35_12]KKP73823.1 MAG: hypothetical protein UR68_C0002G0046 [Candidatus Roizmanbacteria bacterium GW2011_GWA2_35_19]